MWIQLQIWGLDIFFFNGNQKRWSRPSVDVNHHSPIDFSGLTEESEAVNILILENVLFLVEQLCNRLVLLSLQWFQLKDPHFL